MPEKPEPTIDPAKAREALITQKMRDAGMTRENAELVLKHQEENDAKRAKKK